MRHCIRCVVIIIAVSGVIHAQERVFERAYGSVVYRADLVTKGHFDVPLALREWKNVFGAHSKATIVKYELATEKYQVLSVPKSSGASFESWTRSFRLLSSLDWTMAEVISINGSAVMRSRDSSSMIERMVLQGEDPLQLMVGHVRCEILHIDIPPKAVSINFFVQCTDRVETQSAYETTVRLMRLLPLQRVTVKFRSDPWFVFEKGFPEYNPFAHAKMGAPAESIYLGSAMTYCLAEDLQATCNVTGK